MKLLTKDFPTYQPIYLWVCRESPLSLHLIIFEKGSMKPLTKVFPTYHPKYLWVFIYGFAEKGYNKP